MASETKLTLEGSPTHRAWVCGCCSGGGGCSVFACGTFPLWFSGLLVFGRIGLSGDFAAPSWTILGKWLPTTRVDVQVFEGPLWGSLWNIFSVPQLSTSAHQPNALYSSYFGRQLSGILVTWHCHLTWVSLGGCEYWEFWPFLWTPSLEFCLTIWCREVHRGTLGGNDWGAWHVCCR